MNAACPECGAEGFEGVLVIHGRPQSSSRLWMQVVPIACVGLLFASLLATNHSSNARPFRPGWVGGVPVPNPNTAIGLDDFVCLLPLLIAAAICVVLIRRAKRRAAGTSWSFHSHGVLVVKGPSRTYLPRDTIARITMVDFMLQNVSQLAITLKMQSARGLFGRAPIIRIAGTLEARRAIFHSTAPFDPSRTESA